MHDMYAEHTTGSSFGVGLSTSVGKTVPFETQPQKEKLWCCRGPPSSRLPSGGERGRNDLEAHETPPPGTEDPRCWWLVGPYGGRNQTPKLLRDRGTTPESIFWLEHAWSHQDRKEHLGACLISSPPEGMDVKEVRPSFGWGLHSPALARPHYSPCRLWAVPYFPCLAPSPHPPSVRGSSEGGGGLLLSGSKPQPGLGFKAG
jgi:hypothetical protein